MAKRPKIDYEQQSRPLLLHTNYLKIELNKNIEEIYLIRVEFTPKIEADNRVLREKLLNASKAQLKECLGGHYLINASQIFSVERPIFNRDTNIKTIFQKTEYQVNLKITKVMISLIIKNEKSLFTYLNNQYFLKEAHKQNAEIE